MDENSKVLNFLHSSTSQLVNVTIDDSMYELKNLSEYPTNTLVKKYWEKTTPDVSSRLFWYKKCLENKIRPSHAGTISHFL